MTFVCMSNVLHGHVAFVSSVRHMHETFMSSVRHMRVTCQVYVTCMWHSCQVYVTCMWHVKCMSHACDICQVYVTCMWHSCQVYVTCVWHSCQVYVKCICHIHVKCMSSVCQVYVHVLPSSFYVCQLAGTKMPLMSTPRRWTWIPPMPFSMVTEVPLISRWSRMAMLCRMPPKPLNLIRLMWRCVCVRACVRACVCACVCVCAHVHALYICICMWCSIMCVYCVYSRTTVLRLMSHWPCIFLSPLHFPSSSFPPFLPFLSCLPLLLSTYSLPPPLPSLFPHSHPCFPFPSPLPLPSPPPLPLPLFPSPSVQGYYRRASANMALGKFKLALKDYEAVSWLYNEWTPKPVPRYCHLLQFCYNLMCNWWFGLDLQQLVRSVVYWRKLKGNCIYSICECLVYFCVCQRCPSIVSNFDFMLCGMSFCILVTWHIKGTDSGTIQCEVTWHGKLPNESYTMARDMW